MRIRKCLLAALLGIALFAAGCGGDDEGAGDGGGSAEAAGGGSGEQINFFTPTDLIAWHVYLGEATDAYSDAGLNVKVTAFQSGADAAEAFESQGGTVLQSGDVPALRFVSNVDATIVAQITSWTGLRLVVRDDIETPADLEGKKLAVNQGSSTEFWLDRFLEENNLTGKVEVIYLDPGSQGPAMLKGDVDGAATFLPQALTAIESGDFHQIEEWPSALMMVVRNDFLESNREDVVKLVQVISDMGEEIAADDEAALKAVSGMHGLTDEQYIQAMENAEMDFVPQFSSESAELTDLMMDWLKEKGEIPQDFDFCQHADLTVLEEALPDATVQNPCK